MKAPKEARELGKLGQFAKGRKTDATGNEASVEATLQSLTVISRQFR